MSARAAWRLESLGFAQVYRYTAGKTDWFGAGLAREGRLAAVPRAADLARADVPTCGPREPVGAVRARVQAAGADQAVVVNEQRIVLGVLDRLALQAAPETPAEEAMQTAPVTHRPDTLASELAEHLRGGPAAVLVTTGDGELVGLLRAEDAAAAAHLHEPSD
jgi:CBS domain-containing protein